MINIFLKGHNFKHDIFELARVFFPNKEINFVNNDSQKINYEYYIENNLMKEEEKLVNNTRIYNYGKIIFCDSIQINEIKIKGYNLEETSKIGIKKSIYKNFSKISKVDVPWGILTGIRPMKIVHRLLDDSLSYDEIRQILLSHFMLHENKADLLINISKRQRNYIYPLNKDKYSLYLSIPFCPSRCFYCSFPSLDFSKYEHLVKDYVSTLIYELISIKEIMKDKELKTIYVGGGTPTAIPVEDLNLILNTLKNLFIKSNPKEFTVEAGRPDTINYETLRVLKENGVNRISINPQTMNNKTLKTIGRNHNDFDIINTFKLAKSFKFDIINMDMILGLPGEGINELYYTLNQIEKLDPENLTVHTLAVKRGTKLKQNRDNYLTSKEFSMNKMLNETHKFAERMNLSPYYLYRQKQSLGNLENIGFSKNKMECAYNISMMEEKETIIGVGMGAVSKVYNVNMDSIERIPNFKGIKDYIHRIDELIARKAKAII